jgi:hypothetical protein
MPERSELRTHVVPRIALAGVALISLQIFPHKNHNTYSSNLRSEHTEKTHRTMGLLAMLDSFKFNFDLSVNYANKHRRMLGSAQSPTTTTTTTTVPLTPAEIAANEITPTEYAEWSKVNICEEGGKWTVVGPKYSGGLGESDTNWVKYGGLEFALSANLATPDEQMVVGERIQPNVPDQDGCQPGGW